MAALVGLVHLSVVSPVPLMQILFFLLPSSVFHILTFDLFCLRLQNIGMRRCSGKRGYMRERPDGDCPVLVCCVLQERVWSAISKSLELLLVEEALISPDTVSIFNHPSNKVTHTAHSIVQ